jgi:hypothetical protein
MKSTKPSPHNLTFLDHIFFLDLHVLLSLSNLISGITVNIFSINKRFAAKPV